MIKGTDSAKVNLLVKQIPEGKRHKVKEVTLDMAASMEKIVRSRFPQALLVTDRFHVQKLYYDAVQQMRIEYRWKPLSRKARK